MRIFHACLFLILSMSAYAQAKLSGKITSEEGGELPGVVLTLVNHNNRFVTDENGRYEIDIPSDEEVMLRTDFAGFQSKLYFIELSAGERRKLNMKLSVSENRLEDVLVEDERIRERAGAYEINQEELNQLPAVSGGVETLIQSLPGVSAGNELSSQYSVRGGSYDENVVYLNGIEVVRPQLIRSGQQEGLSIINSDMVSNMYFSSGGFEPQYGDKLSSVLDIRYQRPGEQSGNAHLGFMGAGLTLQNEMNEGTFYYSVGGRYQSRRYLLNTLEEEGEYNPESVDVQAVAGYQMNENSRFELLGISNKTTYDFQPNVQSSTFGTFENVLTFDADMQGAETDEFGTDLIALRFENTVNKRFQLAFYASYQSNNEKEFIDIQSDYLLGEQSPQTGEIDTLAVGTQNDLVNNRLQSTIASIKHQGFYETKNRDHYLVWGLGYKQLSFDDQVNETDRLVTIDENGDEEVVMDRIVSSANDFTNHISNAFLQDSWSPFASQNLTMTGGLRLSHSSFTEELLISPRMQASFRPDWEADLLFKAAAGLYQQHPFYREYRNINGEFNNQLQAQKSFHAIVGADLDFEVTNRPFNVTAEAFYKDYWDVIPYEYDIIRIRYLGENLATAYAAGLDLRLYGEFVEDAPSWLSLSVMKTEETIAGQGTIRRPTDQRVNFSTYWQDYFPGNENFKVNMVGEFGGRLPVGVADGNRLNDDFERPAYKRLDVGFSANLKGEKDARLPYSPFENLESIWFSAEVFNLFNIDNTSSYQWVFTPGGATYAVPNKLTGRRLNAKLTVEF